VNPATRSGTPVLWSFEKVIGAPEAARQSWRRRLVIMGDGSWRLLISECGFLSGNDYGLLGFTPGAADAFPIAMPIAAAVALLKSKDSPEIGSSSAGEIGWQSWPSGTESKRRTSATSNWRPPNGNWTRKSGSGVQTQRVDGVATVAAGAFRVGSPGEGTRSRTGRRFEEGRLLVNRNPWREEHAASRALRTVVGVMDSRLAEFFPPEQRRSRSTPAHRHSTVCTGRFR